MNRVTTASLADYAAVINDEHRAAYGCAQQAIEHARIAGEHLMKAKAALKHGEWLPWLAANVEVSESQAQRYMKVAQNWGDLIAKSVDVTRLTIAKAASVDLEPSPRIVSMSAGDWIKDARRAFSPGDQEPCYVCGKYRRLAHAHHVFPLHLQAQRGLDKPIQDFRWVCPTHHAAVHRKIESIVGNARADILVPLNEVGRLEDLSLAFMEYYTGATA